MILREDSFIMENPIIFCPANTPRDANALQTPHWSTTRSSTPALRALLSRGADEVSVVSNAPFALQKELAALRAAAGCPRSRA